MSSEPSILNTNLPPLAQRMRPQTLSDYIGQSALTQEGSLLSSRLAKTKIQIVLGKLNFTNSIWPAKKRVFYSLFLDQKISQVIRTTHGCGCFVVMLREESIKLFSRFDSLYFSPRDEIQVPPYLKQLE